MCGTLEDRGRFDHSGRSTWRTQIYWYDSSVQAEVSKVNFLNDIDRVVREFTITYVITFLFSVSVKRLFSL